MTFMNLNRLFISQKVDEVQTNCIAQLLDSSFA